MRSNDGRVSISTFLAAIVVMGGLQVLQIHFTYLRPAVPNQCDCQCTKKLHISRDTLNSPKEENGGANIPHKPKSKIENEELKRKRILEADDTALDREIAANQSRQSKGRLEDPEEENPYQAEQLKSGDSEDPISIERMVPGALDIDANINISSLLCTTNLLLIYVYSAPGNFQQRKIVRNTYGSVERYDGIRLKVIFFIGGLSAERSTLRFYGRILNESKRHGDLVLDRSYVDSYRNLTLKGVSALRWINRYCHNTFRVMKVDDDTMVNPYNVVSFLKGQSEITMGEIICKVTQGVGPIRNYKSKYFVSAKEYAEDFYPPYCQGYGYIFPPHVIPKILEGVTKNNLIAMEDVFITGVTSQAAGVRLHSLTALYSSTFSNFEIFLERITSRPELLIIGHVHERAYVDVFWKLVKQRQTDKQKEAHEEKNANESEYSDYSNDLDENLE